MFKIVENPEFTHKVRIMVPTDGGHAEQSFRARFRVVPTDESEAGQLDTDEGLNAFLRAAWVGAEELVGDDGSPLPWSDGLRDTLLGLPYVRLALLSTYMSAITRAVSGN